MCFFLVASQGKKKESKRLQGGLFFKKRFHHSKGGFPVLNNGVFHSFHTHLLGPCRAPGPVLGAHQ